MRTTLSRYKFKRIAKESLRNSLRLHGDAMLLYENLSYPSAFQLAVLALEELAKAKWVSHYYYTSITNEGFADAEFEQEWLTLLYSHTEKQYAFVGREVFDYSPKLVRFIESKQLERKKQQSIYVGLDRSRKKIDVMSRISTPERIKEKDAKQLISLVNNEFLEIFETICSYDEYFGIEEVDEVIDTDKHQFVFSWPHKTGLKSRRFLQQHINQAEGGKKCWLTWPVRFALWTLRDKAAQPPVSATLADRLGTERRPSYLLPRPAAPGRLNRARLKSKASGAAR